MRRSTLAWPPLQLTVRVDKTTDPEAPRMKGACQQRVHAAPINEGTSVFLNDCWGGVRAVCVGPGGRFFFATERKDTNKWGSPIALLSHTPWEGSHWLWQHKQVQEWVSEADLEEQAACGDGRAPLAEGTLCLGNSQDSQGAGMRGSQGAWGAVMGWPRSGWSRC